MSSFKNNCAIVISSCDNYHDAWGPFFTLFFRYWPDCPLPIYLVSNSLKYPDERVNTINVVPDQGWSQNLITTIDKIQEKYIIYFQEDYFLRSPVDNEKIFAVLDLAEETSAAYLRLFPCPGPDLPYQDKTDLGLISQHVAYRNCLQTAIWNKQILRNLLRNGETGWDFELRGGFERSQLIKEPFFAYRTPVINYFCTAILKGKYLYDAVSFCKREGIKLDRHARKFENYFQYLFRMSNLKPKLRKLIKGK
jgi:hypothetical protein